MGDPVLLVAAEHGPHQLDDLFVVATNLPVANLAIRRTVVGAAGIDPVLPVVDRGDGRLPIVVVVAEVV